MAYFWLNHRDDYEGYRDVESGVYNYRSNVRPQEAVRRRLFRVLPAGEARHLRQRHHQGN